MDYGHEEVDVKFGRDPRIFNVCSKVNSFDSYSPALLGLHLPLLLGRELKPCLEEREI